MPGRTEIRDFQNLKIVQIDKENNILYISGAVPGARNSLVLISGQGNLKVMQPVIEKAEEVKSEVSSINSEPIKAEQTVKTEAVPEKKVEDKESPAIEEAPKEETKKD